MSHNQVLDPWKMLAGGWKMFELREESPKGTAEA